MEKGESTDSRTRKKGKGDLGAEEKKEKEEKKGGKNGDIPLVRYEL